MAHPYLFWSAFIFPNQKPKSKKQPTRIEVFWLCSVVVFLFACLCFWISRDDPTQTKETMETSVSFSHFLFLFVIILLCFEIENTRSDDLCASCAVCFVLFSVLLLKIDSSFYCLFVVRKKKHCLFYCSLQYSKIVWKQSAGNSRRRFTFCWSLCIGSHRITFKSVFWLVSLFIWRICFACNVRFCSPALFLSLLALVYESIKYTLSILLVECLLLSHW